MSEQKYPHLFSPIVAGGTLFRNRIFAAPTGVSFVDSDGLLMPEVGAYYERKAEAEERINDMLDDYDLHNFSDVEINWLDTDEGEVTPM